MANTFDQDKEFTAIRTVHAALEPLDADARKRVLSYVGQRLGITQQSAGLDMGADESEDQATEALEDTAVAGPDHDDTLDGVSPVALKWMKRAGLTSKEMNRVFSIDLDEIDLTTPKVPGDSKRERVHNVFRLTAIAAYLATGAARVKHEDLKEACSHYDAYDVGNHAKYLKGLGREISGTKESGYTLTATGITSATRLIQEMTKQAS